ncbi:hypothetical protein Fot_07420 [Forsythia ovata]|uniref:Uncharacterized protein n=1 Tax=Forsythia ovata TaxID=205694 RepID=A0ABD1WVS8_9LAMI
MAKSATRKFPQSIDEGIERRFWIKSRKAETQALYTLFYEEEVKHTGTIPVDGGTIEETEFYEKIETAFAHLISRRKKDVSVRSQGKCRDSTSPQERLDLYEEISRKLLRKNNVIKTKIIEQQAKIYIGPSPIPIPTIRGPDP